MRAPLILKRALCKSPFSQWSDDDYDVLENSGVVGRIFLSSGAPQERPWMLASGHKWTHTPRGTWVMSRRVRPR
jgi:hypothetical protein